MLDLSSHIFLTGLAFLFAHELDAIRQSEWRFFFAWTPLSDEMQYRLFAALHVPLFILIVAYWNAPSFQVSMDVFLMAHLCLHYFLRDHRHLTFTSPSSWVWIVGAAVLGALHLALTVTAPV